MSAHTPGPWMVGGPFPSVSVCRQVDDGAPPTWDAVCILDSRTTGSQSKQALADARLIAAAPELLAALKSALESTRCRNAKCNHSWHAAGRAAIAKAEGSET